MTRMSILDTADDLDPDLGYQTMLQGVALLRSLTTDDGVYDDRRPEFRMWEYHELALSAYLVALEASLATRGVFSFQHHRVHNDIDKFIKVNPELQFEPPAWFADTDVLRSHRSNLARRWPKTYGKRWKGTPTNMPYLWPFIDREHPSRYKLFVSKHDKALVASGERTLPKAIRERVENL